MPLALKFIDHRETPGSRQRAQYFAGRLHLEPGTIIRIPAAGLVLGRGEAAHVRVASSLVARVHARVWLSEHCLEVEDLGSTNGTTSSRGQETRLTLVEGDMLTIACVFDFEVVAVP